MAQQVKLTVQTRAQVGRNAIKKVRKEGLIPGVIYGVGQEPINLELNGRQLSTVLAHASSENILLELEIVDGDNKRNSLAMIKEVQHHPLERQILHVDFHAVGGIVIGIAQSMVAPDVHHPRRLYPKSRPLSGRIGKLDARFVVSVPGRNPVLVVNKACEIGAVARVGGDHQATIGHAHGCGRIVSRVAPPVSGVFPVCGVQAASIEFIRPDQRIARRRRGAGQNRRRHDTNWNQTEDFSHRCLTGWIKLKNKCIY